MKTINLSLSPKQAADPVVVGAIARQKAGLPKAAVRVVKRSIDARKAPVKVRLVVQVGEVGQAEQPAYVPSQNLVAGEPVIIVGSGPAGLFAALRLIELGVKPVILERGKDVQARRRDLAQINRAGIVNPDSNYCFGEGGAGTYSDGKLYTRAKKRGDVGQILAILHYHGAPETILVDAHPHIGTNKLPGIIASIRQYILAHGGEIHFNTRVDDLLLNRGQLLGVKAADVAYEGRAVILATGHSARDIYQVLADRKVHLEAKPFAMGVRVEHPQGLIDSIQYHCRVRDPYLPAASYSLVRQVDYRQTTKGVFSFCMCPGGFMVPAATAPGEVVINGMSPSRRNSRFANSGIVVALDDHEIGRAYGDSPLRYMHFQQAIEQQAFMLGGASLAAPAQRLTDFVRQQVSSSLPPSSYKPGMTSVAIDTVLPPAISARLRYAFRQFGRKMRGYLTEEAVILAVESRTSSPVRVPRDPHTLEHVALKRLFPAGEGAGYAGGIVSAALDGQRCADRVVQLYAKKE